MTEEYCVLDIETTPINYEDREILDYQIDKSFNRDFHPFFAKVIAVGLKSGAGDPELLSGDKEPALLGAFWHRVRVIGPTRYVTFNGYQFDVPFLLIRSKINRIQPTAEINLNIWKMEESNHFDCMQSLSVRRAFPWVSLEITCRVMGVPLPKSRVSAKRIRELYEDGEWKKIEEHCRQDLQLTEQLYSLLAP